MAELVDASDSKSGVRKDVQVRFLFWAQPLGEGFFYARIKCNGTSGKRVYRKALRLVGLGFYDENRVVPRLLLSDRFLFFAPASND